MGKKELSIEEIEKLSYYDFMGYMKVPTFAIGGMKSVDRLGELCKLDQTKKVLVVGCGTGGNAIRLVHTFGCSIIGIDISENMVNNANIRAEEESLTHKAKFQIGDAYKIDFPDNSFDAVITVFVSQFLDLPVVFKEFQRVVKPGGYVGTNEMYKETDIPEEIAKKIKIGEGHFQELTELPFTLFTIPYYKEAFTGADLGELIVETYKDYKEKGAVKKMLKDMGGWKVVSNSFGRMMKVAFRSKIIRKRFGLISKAKRSFLQNKKSSKYVGYVLCVGKK
jgi:ubiquinone/menaquinone biosynthesis C-methylase UbiE